MPLVSDEVTTLAMTKQYDTTRIGYASALSQVDSSASALATFWQSDTASKAYLDAIVKWQEGLKKVGQGLDELDGAMSKYRINTETSETDNTKTATDWHLPR